MADRGLSYRRETVAIENESAEELPKRQRLQHPATKPPGSLPLATVLNTPYQTIRLAVVPAELECAEKSVDGHGNAKLFRWVDTKRQASQGGANRGGVWGCESRGCPGVAPSKRLDLGIEKMYPQASEEAEEPPIEQEDRGERERQPQRRRLVEWLLLRIAGRLLAAQPPLYSLPALHAEPCDGEHPQGVPHCLSVEVVRALLGLQRLVHARRAGGRASQDSRAGQDVFMQSRILAGRDCIS